MSENLPNLIGIIGKARSGKSTVANYLRDNCGYEIVSCASPLKQLVVQALTNNPPPMPEEIYAAQGEGWHKLIYHDRTPFTRWLLQFVGTDIGRALDSQIWVKQLTRKLRDVHIHDNVRIVVPDVRFTNEVEAIKKLDGVIWRTIRTDDHGGVEHGAGHASETELSHYKADFTIKVPKGVDWLYRAVKSYNASMMHGIPIRSYRGADGVELP